MTEDEILQGLLGGVKRGWVRIVEKPSDDPMTWKFQITELGKRYVQNGFPKEGYA